jgi:uncharacterized damage-inducible protein DinB
MTTMLRDAFGHHSWATGQLLDVCATVPEDELATPVPAIYGNALETLRHLIDADNWYLLCISQGELGDGDFEADDLPFSALRPVADATAAGWETLLSRSLDPDEVIVVVRKDGSTTRATVGIRLAQVLHHGSDHRSQVCTALTTLGHEPPEFDVWAYGWTQGTVSEEPAPPS